MKKVWIGIDNGVSGTLGVFSTFREPVFMKNPVVKVQDYTKAKKMISRLDAVAFYNLLNDWKKEAEEISICLERPMVNPGMFKASESALRCFEAMWAIIDILSLPVQFIPSTDWQKELLPHGIKGADELKKASFDIGNRLFPQFKDFKHPDRDGLLIAYWMKKNNL